MCTGEYFNDVLTCYRENVILFSVKLAQASAVGAYFSRTIWNAWFRVNLEAAFSRHSRQNVAFVSPSAITL